VSGVYLACNKASIKGTLNMLRYYRGYIRSDPDKVTSCHDIQDRLFSGRMDSREAAQSRVWKLVNTAINRKAGIPDSVVPLQVDIELWRDCQLVQHLVHRNNPCGLQWLTWHPKKFRTRWIQRRYGRLLEHYWEMHEL
jgi:hypothetical protein